MLKSIMTDPVSLQSFLICLITAMVLGVLTALVFPIGAGILPVLP